MWKYLEWMISTNLVEFVCTFWGVLGHKSVCDFSSDLQDSHTFPRDRTPWVVCYSVSLSSGSYTTSQYSATAKPTHTKYTEPKKKLSQNRTQF